MWRCSCCDSSGPPTLALLCTAERGKPKKESKMLNEYVVFEFLNCSKGFVEVLLGCSTGGTGDTFNAEMLPFQ